MYYKSVQPCWDSGRLGPLLFQFPPQDVQAIGGPGQFAERLHRFLDAYRGATLSLELRNADLLTAHMQGAQRRCRALF
jgi:uncharacterized protein YecE (DUF72 family)